MCIYSMIGPAFEPTIPIPSTDPFQPFPMQPNPMPVPWGPVPSTGLPIIPEDLRILLDSFHKAVEAAKAADKAAGQPDCTDPAKIKLEERVAELERRLQILEGVQREIQVTCLDGVLKGTLKQAKKTGRKAVQKKARQRRV